MSTDDLDQISRLFRLRESGALSQQEFEAEKARILEGEGDDTSPPSEIRKPSIAVEQDETCYNPPATRSKWWIGLLVLVVLAAGIGAAWFSMRSGTGANDQKTDTNMSAPITAPTTAKAIDTSPTPTANQDQPGLYQWATSTEVLGLTPEFLASKLGPVREQVGTSLDFSVAGCDIKYEVENKAVVYFDAEVSGSCKPSLKGLDAASSIDLTHGTTLADVERKAGGLIIADCIGSCGNATDPAQYLFIQGPHSDNWVNVAVRADPKSSGGLEKWSNAIRKAHGLTVDAELPAQAYECGTEAQDAALQDVGPIPISRVVVGAGATKEKLTQCGVDTE